MGVRSAVGYEAPRYEIPEQVFAANNEPDTGTCWNCAHALEVRMGGKVYLICAAEHDEHGGLDACECDESTRDCKDWAYYDVQS